MADHSSDLGKAAKRLSIPLWGRILIAGLVLVFGFIFEQFYSFKSDVEKQFFLLNGDFENLRGQVSRIPITLSGKLISRSVEEISLNHNKQASQSLAMASNLIENANSEKVMASKEYFGDASNNLKAVLDRKPPEEVTEEAHRAIEALATYRSSLETKPPLTGQSKAVDMSVHTQVNFHGDITLLLGAYALNDYVHGDIFTVPALPRLENNIVISGPAAFVGMVPDASQTLDGIHWRDGITFVNIRIKYNGGPVELQNIRFVDCTFEIADTPLGDSLAYALANAKQSIVLKEPNS